MMKKFGIGNAPQLRPKSDAHYRVTFDRIWSRYRTREWVQIQRGLLCEQNAVTVV
jgi:hypothetical protein